MKKYSTFGTQLGESALDLTDKAKLSLYKKSQNSGISTDILEEVYRRGYRCWTEAFGGTPEQFAFDRVNSFIADGFAAQLDEDLKKACWKGYEAIGMKKKNGKTVPNCVPVKEQLNAPLPPIETIAKKFDKPVDVIKKAIKSGSKVEKEHTKEQKTAEKIATAHVNERPDYYKKLNKAGLEEQEEARSKDPSKPCSRFIGSDELVTIYKSQTPGQLIKKVVREAAMQAATAPAPTAADMGPRRLGRYQPSGFQSRVQPGGEGLRNVGQNRYSASSPTNLKGARSMTSGSTQATAKTLTPQRVSANPPAPKTASAPTSAPKPSASFGSSSRPTTASATSSGMQKSPGFNISSGMSDAGKAKVKPTAPVEIPASAGKAVGALGKLARVATGPAATAAMTVMEPTPAGEKTSEFQRQADVAKGISYKAQGRSITDYEKSLAPNNPAPPKPKVDVPTPPSRPEYMSRGQAFQAARSEKGGAGGQFSYGGKDYQTNVAGEKYVAKPTTTSVKDETESGKVKKIKEAISEATYKGKKVTLNKPMAGDVKKSKVFVDPDGDGKAQKVNFGDKNMSIKKDQPARKKSYCARSGGQGNLNDKTSANYWSRRAWNCEETEE